MRIIVRAILPLGEGTILDPFMGSGSTIAVAEAVGYSATGLELDTEYFRLAEKAIPRLAALYPEFEGQAIDVELNGSAERDEPQDQLALVLEETPPHKKPPAARSRRGTEVSHSELRPLPSAMQETAPAYKTRARKETSRAHS